jgi:hypothetical protein
MTTTAVTVITAVTAVTAFTPILFGVDLNVKHSSYHS